MHPYLEPLLGTSEPSGSFTWNWLRTLKPDSLLGTLTWSYVEEWNLHLELLLETLEPSETYLEPQNLLELSFGTLIWNLPTSWNLYAEPLVGTLEPSETLPLLGIPSGTFTWNSYLKARNLLNLYLEPVFGTLKPSKTFTWNPHLEPRNLLVRPQNFELLVISPC